MKLELVHCHRWSEDATDYEAFVRYGTFAQFGYGDTPLQAARRAWRAVKRMIALDIMKTLTS